MSDQQELRQRREALAQAVNSHDLEAVLSFIDPSFVAKTKRGVSVGYKDMACMVGQLFAEEKEYHETVEIEKSEVDNDSAELVVRRIERGRLHDPKRVGLFNGLGIMCLFMGFMTSLRAGEWDAQKIFATVGFAVFTVGFFGFAQFLQRSRERTVRNHETWRTIDGRWLLVEEQEL